MKDEDESSYVSDQNLPHNIEIAANNLKKLLCSPIFLENNYFRKYSISGEATQLPIDLELYNKRLGFVKLSILDELCLKETDLISSQFEINSISWKEKLQELVNSITIEFGYSDLRVTPKLEKIINSIAILLIQ